MNIINHSNWVELINKASQLNRYTVIAQTNKGRPGLVAPVLQQVERPTYLPPQCTKPRKLSIAVPSKTPEMTSRSKEKVRAAKLALEELSTC